MRRSLVGAITVVGLAVVLTATAGTPSFAGDDPDVIHACIKKNNGQLRVVRDPGLCTPAEQSIELPAAGTQGALADGVKPRTAFVTSGTFNGNLGGLEGADEKCQAAADAVTLPGVYKAWLSDDSAAPVMRFNVPLGPIHDTLGATIAGSWGDLTDGSLNRAIQLTESGTPVAGINTVWTATGTDGSRRADNCENWTDGTASAEAHAGAANFADANWTAIAAPNTACRNALHLYYFEP